MHSLITLILPFCFFVHIFGTALGSECTHNSLNDFLALSVLEGHHKEEGKVGADSHPISLVNTQ